MLKSKIGSLRNRTPEDKKQARAQLKKILSIV
jgi:hypothetical protein